MAKDMLFDGIEDVFPASPAQAGMLFESLRAPASGVNLGLLQADLPATLDVAGFKAAWQETCQRHQSLRSHFLWEGLSAPVQVVRQEIDLAWTERDWRDRADPQRELAALRETLRRAPLDLSRAPAMEFFLIALPERQVFLWRTHHALLDDWSVDTLLRETEQHYLDAQRAPSDPMPYRAFADWLANRDETADRDHWCAHLAGVSGPTRMGFARPDRMPSGEPAHRPIGETLAPAATDALRSVARERRVTLGAVLSAVWAVVLHRLSGSDDVAFGLAATQRPPELPGADRAVGNFVATLPARLRFTPQLTLADAISQRHMAALEAQGRAAPLLSDLNAALELDAGQPLFDTILAINESDFGADPLQLYGSVALQNYSSFPVAVVMHPGEALGVTILADPCRLDMPAQTQVLEMLVTALQEAPRFLHRPCFDLPVRPGSAWLKGSELPEDLPLLPDVIAAQAQTRAAHPALIDGSGETSYGELARMTDALAAQLQEAGVDPGARVAVLLERGAVAVAAFLAVWRIGAAYVPLDPTQGRARLNRMLSSARVAAVLSDGPLAALLDDGPFLRLQVRPDHPGKARPQRVTPGDTAYVMFTSGSTGTPKGVVVSHGNLAASNAARLAWYDAAPQRFLMVSPLGFDSSVAGLYWTLATGGAVILPDAQTVQDIPALLDCLQTHRASHLLCLPSLYELMLASAEPDMLSSLDCAIVAGEAAGAAMIARHHVGASQARLVNEYGPTEATVWCSATDLPLSDEPVTIGAPIPGLRVSIRDEKRRAVAPGLPGELWVAGPGIAQGYFEAPELSAQAFVEIDGARAYRTGDLVRQRPDGQLELLGRIDQQIKIRGQRIELPEIEAALTGCDGVESAAVIALPATAPDRLIAYVSGTATVEALRAQCAATLSAVMQPHDIFQLDCMPRSANGKLDRRALAARGIPCRPAAAASVQSPLEGQVMALWQEILGTSAALDLQAGFFAQGGDSLKAMRLVALLVQRMKVRLSIAEIFGPAQSIRGMARLIADREAEGPPQDGAEISGDVRYPVQASIGQAALWLASKTHANQPFFNLTSALCVTEISESALTEAVRRLADRHEILRGRLRLQDRKVWIDLSDELPEVVLSTGSAEDVQTWIAARSETPFNMDHGPLWRIAAMGLGDGRMVVALVIHHALCDGWSQDLLLKDLVRLLKDPEAMGAPPPSFAAHLVEPRGETAQGTAAFWHKILQDPPPPVEIAPDKPVPRRAMAQGVFLRQDLHRDISERFRERVTQQGATVFAGLWAALGLYHGDRSGQRDSLIAVSHANRIDPRYADTVGCFTKALPYRLDLSDVPHFADAVQRAQDMMRQVVLHEDVVPEELALPQSPFPRSYLSGFASVTLQYNDFSTGVFAGDRESTPLALEPRYTSVFPVSLEWSWQQDRLSCALLARADLFDRATLGAWLSGYLAKIASILDD